MRYTLSQGRIAHPLARMRVALYRLLAESSTALASLALLITPLLAYTAPAHAVTAYQASDVLGQPDFTSATSNNPALTNNANLSGPAGTVLDATNHRLFVSDCNNNRVLIFGLDADNNSQSHVASHVLGQPDFNSTSRPSSPTAANMYCPWGQSYDAEHNRLFVADNQRVLVYDLSNGVTDGMDASFVIGQPDFTSPQCNSTPPTQSNLCGIEPVLYNPDSQQLFVGDGGRVLVYDLSSGITNGMNASYVLGQPDFTTNTRNTTQNGFNYPYDLAYDTQNKRLFLGDENNRVLVYDLSSGITNGMNASYVLGQPDFTSSTGNVSQNGFECPDSLAYEPKASLLFVGDCGSGNRVLVFDVKPGTITNGENAIGILGQPDYTSSSCTPTSQSSNCDPEGTMAYDAVNHRLWVPEFSANRVTIFNFARLVDAPVGQVGSSYSQILGTQTQGSTTYAVTGGTLPDGLTLNVSSGLLSGTPTTAGTFNFSISLVDDNGSIGSYGDSKNYVVSVTSSAVSPSVENAAPNSGDANNDGTSDSQQANVTSLVNPVTGTYSVLQTTCVTNNDIGVASEATNASHDTAFDYPAGLENFTLSGCNVGGTSTITQFFYGDLNPALLVERKYNAVSKTYTTVPGALISQVSIGGKAAIKVTYQITDGGPLDQDGQANGVIVDPSGPAMNAAGVPNTGLGGSRFLSE